MKRERFLSLIFRVTTGVMASSPFLILLFILIVLVRDAIPAIRYQGSSFFTGVTWNMGNMYANNPFVHNGVQAAPGASFGILPFIMGTLGSSLIALLIGVPFALMTAFALVYKVPKPIQRVLSPMVELLAGIPSVVYGLWGVESLSPFIEFKLGPLLTRLGHAVPFLAGPVGTGFGLLTSGLVLAVMIIPIITATTRDLLMQVPTLSLEGAHALGLTSFESVRFVAYPWVKRGIFGAIVLGLGRALGETMAVLMVSGDAANYLPYNLYSPISTMASTIAALLDSALTDFTGMSVHALAFIALTLLVITVITNLIARLLVSMGRQNVHVEM